MKRLLLPLLAALALPTAVNADPLRNILKQTLKGGTKETIRNESKKNKKYVSPSTNFFGKYRSKAEAKEACNIWVKKGVEHSYEISGKPLGGGYLYLTKNGYVVEGTNRYCRFERDTSQYLGYEFPGVKKNQHFKASDTHNIKKYKIKKYFKY